MEEIILIDQPPSTKWEKRKVEEGCTNGDCYTWCLVSIPARKLAITVLSDTTQSNNYEWRSYDLGENSDKEPKLEWIEVVCFTDITAQLIGDIQDKLRGKGYYTDQNTSELDSKTKEALVNYQKQNNLATVPLSIETMKKLEVSYSTNE